MITTEDLQQTQTQSSDALGVLDELMTEAATADLTALFVAQDQGTAVHLIMRRPGQRALPPAFQQKGPEYFVATYPGDIQAVAQRIITELEG